MAVGIPNEPEVFYFGAAGGGVWKTTDAGRTWQGLMQHENSSSIGAIDIAPSNPNIIYAGTGQVAFRWDISSGDGVYRSTDGGENVEECRPEGDETYRQDPRRSERSK